MSESSKTVVLVDEKDNPIGSADKYEAHRLGQLHRAFSVFIFRYLNNQVELLMQQRAHNKHHSGGLWTNTCCGHPSHPTDNLSAVARERLQEEMGFSIELSEIGSFHYQTQLSNGLWENEIDHVLVAMIDNPTLKFSPDPTEVADHQWVSVESLEEQIGLEPDRYTYWLLPALDVVKQKAKIRGM